MSNEEVVAKWIAAAMLTDEEWELANSRLNPPAETVAAPEPTVKRYVHRNGFSDGTAFVERRGNEWTCVDAKGGERTVYREWTRWQEEAVTDGDWVSV